MATLVGGGLFRGGVFRSMKMCAPKTVLRWGLLEQPEFGSAHLPSYFLVHHRILTLLHQSHGALVKACVMPFRSSPTTLWTKQTSFLCSWLQVLCWNNENLTNRNAKGKIQSRNHWSRIRFHQRLETPRSAQLLVYCMSVADFVLQWECVVAMKTTKMLKAETTGHQCLKPQRP